MPRTIRKNPVELKTVFRLQRLGNLQDYYHFWHGDGAAPDSVGRIIPALQERMSSETVVRRRLKSLSKKLVDILKFFLRSESYSSNMRHIINSQVFSYMNQYEVEASLNALQKRGFVYRVKGKLTADFGKDAFLIPRELGETLHNFLWDEEKEAHDTFSLEGYLEKTCQTDLAGRIVPVLKSERKRIKNPEEATGLLASQPELEHRVAGLEDDGLKAVFRLAVAEYGGIMPRTLYEKGRGRSLPAWNKRAWKESLEKNLLGTIRHLSLGEYGINHFDDTFVVFRELVDSTLGNLDEADPGGLEEIRTLGVDLVSDITSFLSFVEHNRIRLTLNGSIYKTAVKKIEETFILTEKEEFEGSGIFDFVYAFCLGNRMIQRKGDRQLGLTVKGKSWERQPLEKKLLKILSSAYYESEPANDYFHMPRLKKLFIENIKKLGINRWYDVMYLPFKTRNAYLSDLDRSNIRDAFQNCYQYNRNTGMKDIQQMAHSLFQWMRARFYLLGLVDLGFRSGKVEAMLLNPLGAKVLGVEFPEEEGMVQKPLIVNPDFEVILFQDGNNYDLITRMDRFALRTKSDNAYHYKITTASVEKAVAEGMTASEILALLSENSRVGIPQNVIYSIREWAEKVKFVRMRDVTILRGRNKEVIDRIIQAGVLKGIIVERLAPAVLMIKSGSDRKKLGKTLEKLGIFLEKGHATTKGNKKG